MKIGTTLHLKIKDLTSDKTIKCRCKIIGKDDENLFIDYPINIDTEQTCYLYEGTKLSVTYLSDHKNLFQFKTQIKNKIKRTVPTLVMPYPDKDDIKQIQRREFVRINTAIDVAVHFPDETYNPFTTVTNDISAGGISIIIPYEEIADKDWSQGKRLSLSIVLYSSTLTKYIHLDGELVRMKMLKENVQTASIKFLNTNNHTRQELVHFCFEKQREERKKELI